MIGSDLADLAARLHLRRGGRSWRGDCPCCGYADAFALRTGTGSAPGLFCANGCDRDMLRDALSNVSGELSSVAPPRDAASLAATRQRKQEAAARLWAGSEPALGTLAERNLIRRGLPDLAASPALRFRGDCQHPEGSRLPAMIAKVVDLEGNFLAVHRTYLRRDGGGKADVEPAKASLGPVWSGAIRLHEPVADRSLVIGEGIESSASAGKLLGCPSWSALSAGNLARGLMLPHAVLDVVIAADADAAGEAAALAAALRWQAEGRRVRIARPNVPGQDFNDVLRALLVTGADDAA